jgi:hypothetical protein
MAKEREPEDRGPLVLSLGRLRGYRRFKRQHSFVETGPGQNIGFQGLHENTSDIRYRECVGSYVDTIETTGLSIESPSAFFYLDLNSRKLSQTLTQ